MKQIWIITKREISVFFDSLIAYILIIVFLGLGGFFTWLFGSNIFALNQASLQVFFAVSYWTLFFFIPALTMRTLAEEKRSGTIELLVTKPITDWQIILGKFLSCLILVCIAILCTIPYYITVSSLGPIDHGSVFGGYLGLVLMSAAYIGIGIFASSITNNQIVAFLLALFIGIFFQLLFHIIANSGFLRLFFDYLSLNTHFDSLSRGVIDSRDIIYFLSIAFIGLFLAQTFIRRERT